MHIGLHVQYPLFVLDFNKNLKFLDRLLESTPVQIRMKIRGVAAVSFHAAGLRRMTKLIVTLRNFGNAPKDKYKTKRTGVLCPYFAPTSGLYFLYSIHFLFRRIFLCLNERIALRHCTIRIFVAS
jgi:hypothetical protein